MSRTTTFLMIAAVVAIVAAEKADARVEYHGHGTSYCLNGRMADGTWTRPRSAASNRHPLGTRIRLTGAAGPRGMRRYVIRDRIGWGSDLDLWVGTRERGGDCGAAIRWGAKPVRYVIGWRRR